MDRQTNLEKSIYRASIIIIIIFIRSITWWVYCHVYVYVCELNIVIVTVNNLRCTNILFESNQKKNREKNIVCVFLKSGFHMQNTTTIQWSTRVFYLIFSKPLIFHAHICLFIFWMDLLQSLIDFYCNRA